MKNIFDLPINFRWQYNFLSNRKCNIVPLRINVNNFKCMTKTETLMLTRYASYITALRISAVTYTHTRTHTYICILFTAFNFLLPFGTYNLRIPHISLFTRSGYEHWYLYAFRSRTLPLVITILHSCVSLFLFFFSFLCVLLSLPSLLLFCTLLIHFTLFVRV